jgi:glycine cleavage system aminomethyltransferase T
MADSFSLEDKIQKFGGALNMLRGPQNGSYPFPIKAEFTNWRDEQESWRKTAVLFDQSHHMTDLVVEGPDCYRLLSTLGANSFKDFGPMKAKQFVTCNQDGYVIGDCILFCLADKKVRIAGRPPALNWVEYHAKTGGYDVATRRDERTAQNPKGRELFRFQVQGPNAMHILERVNGGSLPDVKFFHMGKFKIGKHEVTALNHRMSGFPGLEFWGPYAEIDGVRDELLKAGEECGLRQGGGRTYSSVATESGWIASTVPAIYTGEYAKPYRQWLNARSFEGSVGLGGSYFADRVEDYYTTPWDLGYGFIVKFDHDFIGREALEKMANQKHRKKAWLYWHRDDVVRIFASLYEPGDRRFKYIDMPSAFYSAMPFDRIDKNGKLIGVSTLAIYSSNVRSWISLCMINEDALVYGQEVSLTWGEPNGGAQNLAVERHVQTTIRATVGPKPFSEEKQGSSNKS